MEHAEHVEQEFETDTVKEMQVEEGPTLKKNQFIQEIDIEFLTLQKGKNKASASASTSLYKLKDKLFYKKRIYQLTKQLLGIGEPSENDFSTDVTFCFDHYVKACIEHFKKIDKTEILQNEYKDFECSGSVPVPVDGDVDGLMLFDECGIGNSADCDMDVANANQLIMFGLQQKSNSLENFVKVTKNSILKEEIVYPIKKKINIKDPSFKVKGLMPKRVKQDKQYKQEDT
jgi:hypothetical protein